MNGGGRDEAGGKGGNTREDTKWCRSGEGGDKVDGGSRIIIKKSRNLDRVGRAERSDANLKSKIQLFENISRRKIQAEDSAEYDHTQKVSEGGLDLT